MEILPGGAGTPTVQMIGAGSAEFGIVSGDELVVARARGNDVVALFAVFQNCPQGIMAHASRHLASIGDVLKEGTLAIQRGLPYARILEKKYGFDHVKVVPSPGGDISAFLRDENFAQQCFVMSEPLQARHAGVDVKVFPVADIGYNPYTTVLATSGAHAQEQSGSRQGNGRGRARRLESLPGRSEADQQPDARAESLDGCRDLRRSRRGAEAVSSKQAS